MPIEQKVEKTYYDFLLFFSISDFLAAVSPRMQYLPSVSNTVCVYLHDKMEKAETCKR